MKDNESKGLDSVESKNTDEELKSVYPSTMVGRKVMKPLWLV
jgi:hypothetical protein